jgi:hypothetical protein
VQLLGTRVRVFCTRGLFEPRVVTHAWFKVQAQFKSTTSKIHPGRSGVASIPKEPKQGREAELRVSPLQGAQKSLRPCSGEAALTLQYNSQGSDCQPQWPECFIPHSRTTVQYSTVQYSTVQYSAVQCSTVQYNATQYCTMVLYSLSFTTSTTMKV